MKNAAAAFGMLGAVAGSLLCLGMFAVTLLATVFVPVAVWWFIVIAGLAIVTVIGFQGAVILTPHSLRGTLSMLIAAMIWAVPGFWLLYAGNGYYRISLISPALLFGIGGLFAWILHAQSRKPDPLLNGTC